MACQHSLRTLNRIVPPWFCITVTLLLGSNVAAQQSPASQNSKKLQVLLAQRDVERNAKPTPCKPHGYWVLQLHLLTGTCKNQKSEELKFLFNPTRAEQKREADKNNPDSQTTEPSFDIVESKAITKSIMADGMCMLVLDVWPNDVEPWEENYRMTLLEKGEIVNGVGIAIFHNAFGTDADISCLQQFTVSGKWSQQVPAK